MSQIAYKLVELPFYLIWNAKSLCKLVLIAQ